MELRDAALFLDDLGSTNGTFIGDFPSTATRRVLPGQVSSVCETHSRASRMSITCTLAFMMLLIGGGSLYIM